MHNRFSLPRGRFTLGGAFWKTFKCVFLVLMSAFVILPFAWMIITSLMPSARSLLIRPFKLPIPPNFSNYVEALRMQPFGVYAGNSLFVSSAATILSVLTAMMGGYAFALIRFPFKRLLFTLLLAVLMMPTQVSIISLYVTMSRIGWLDSYWALIIPFIADAYGIYLIKQNFESIPIDFVESARIEGAGHWRILFQILMHLAKPSLIAYGVMSFKWRWNDYFWVLMMTSSKEMRTLPVGLVMMKVEDGGSQWHLIMAATMLVILPLILIYLFVQKGLSKNTVAGGIKG